ncbi:TIM barrel protein [uncultured Paludibaculum sp.]|uniref:sugar phosphate isomerase/epimerase family protein n=1 Tax=uncultured Paludibaculum sp. TaxID=1765020 RepID=UPI002AAC137B|nr:TIM barrel protein [uncultured Paludibaculum sp.]
MLNRRQFLATSALAGGSVLSGAKSKLRIGVTDWNLRMAGEVGAVATAAQLGFEGVEVSLGRKPVDGKLPLDNAELIAKYVAAAKEQKIALAGTCLDILHVNYLKNDKQGQKWVGDSIPITKKLNARVVLLPFFGKGALETRAEQEYVGDVLKEYAKEAEKAGILLGLEDTISAEDNVRILDRVASKHLKVYYDVGNSTNGGFDVLKEIPWLGASRICQFHLKDKGYLGEGSINFPEVMKRIMALGFTGFANLETSSPSKVIANDMRRNLDFVRKSMG